MLSVVDMQQAILSISLLLSQALTTTISESTLTIQSLFSWLVK